MGSLQREDANGHIQSKSLVFLRCSCCVICLKSIRHVANVIEYRILAGWQCLLLMKHVVLPVSIRAALLFTIRFTHNIANFFKDHVNLGAGRRKRHDSGSTNAELKPCCVGNKRGDCWACSKTVCEVSLQMQRLRPKAILNRRHPECLCVPLELSSG